MFTYNCNQTTIFDLLYIDDVIINDNNEYDMSDIKQFLAQSFSIEDLSNLFYFLDIEVSRSKIGIFLCQRKYKLDILSDSGMTGCRPLDFPMEQHICLQPNDGSPLPDPTISHGLIDHILYLTMTQSNIQYVVNTFNQFIQSPYSSHLDVTILRYLKRVLANTCFFQHEAPLIWLFM